MHNTLCISAFSVCPWFNFFYHGRHGENTERARKTLFGGDFYRNICPFSFFAVDDYLGECIILCVSPRSLFVRGSIFFTTGGTEKIQRGHGGLYSAGIFIETFVPFPFSLLMI